MLVVVVEMWCSFLLYADQRIMLGHTRFSLSSSELKWNASQWSFYCCLWVLLLLFKCSSCVFSPGFCYGMSCNLYGCQRTMILLIEGFF
ncbi:hypothetical protein ACE6H2_006122 [Prunus campanulata]